jgi:hypothetical protein
MYITSDLFGGAPTHTRGDTATSAYWTAMPDSPHTASLGKRKRQEAEEGPSTYGSCRILSSHTKANSICNSCSHQPRSLPASRGSTRPQLHTIPGLDSNRNLPYSVYSTSPILPHSERRPVKQMKRFSPKATLVKSTSHLMDIEPELPKANTHAHTVNDLRPCHACKSAPKRRRDLENYLDCRRCDGRTCYICARQCFGGCGKAICKKCIVEVGEEGDPWCLDCYARNINS